MFDTSGSLVGCCMSQFYSCGGMARCTRRNKDFFHFVNHDKSPDKSQLVHCLEPVLPRGCGDPALGRAFAGLPNPGSIKGIRESGCRASRLLKSAEPFCGCGCVCFVVERAAGPTSCRAAYGIFWDVRTNPVATAAHVTPPVCTWVKRPGNKHT